MLAVFERDAEAGKPACCVRAQVTPAHGLTPNELSELIFAVARGMLMRDVLQPQEMTAAERRSRQLEVTRRLWRLLFNPEDERAYA